MSDTNPTGRNLKDFEHFAKKVAAKVPRTVNSYRNGFGYNYSTVSSSGFTEEQIRQILESGNPDSIRDLSRYFSRFSGPYGRALQYYATLLNYSYLIVPHYDIDSRPKKIKAAQKKISHYIKELHLNYVLPKINMTVLTEGIYFGLLLEDSEEKPVFYKLPSRFCRSRFLDSSGLPILEINVNYFDVITQNKIEKKAVLKLFPKYVQNAYNNKKDKKDFWVEIPPCDGGLCFFFNEDQTPPFAAATLSASDLTGARQTEKKRDSNELQKLLIHKLPIRKDDGELLIELPEAEVLHDSVCNMLSDNDTIEVLTTYGDVTLESVQDTEAAASSSSTRLKKYVDSVYDDLGTSSSIFNAGDGSTALTFSIKKDISLMFTWSQQYELAINAFLRKKAKTNSLYFSIKILPTSSIFRKEDVDTYLKTAQYGYPKSTVATVIGLDVIDLSQVTDFENNVLHLEKTMLPLQSSYTTSGKEENSSSSEKKVGKDSTPSDLTNEGGRPEKNVEERADRTEANREGST